jgi:myo-inositol 2-dehydrogenase / D-chiro-inositol 1-dehydrogenase
MRIGLIGLGRIGAFHAGTLSALPSGTSLVVTDALPAAIQREAGAPLSSTALRRSAH